MEITNSIKSMPDCNILESRTNAVSYLGKTHLGREIWLDKDELTRHLLVVGSTGSGKSELLLGMIANSLAAGHGALFVDGKGDLGTYARIHALASIYGRQNDLLLLNFSHGLESLANKNQTVSNTINPFMDLGADSITQILVSLMGNVSHGDDMWQGRAIAMITAVVKVAVWIRDDLKKNITISDLRKFCLFTEIVDFSDNQKYPDMPKKIRESIVFYLKSLAGFQPEKGHKQAQTTLDQHGYLEMQTTRTFSTLGDVYGHIFNTLSSNIDMKDIVLNRRIVLVTLPVLEKSSMEVENLGRIVISLLKDMMSKTMHVPVEGKWRDVVENRCTNSDYPFLVIMDEVSHYMTDGMGAMAAQGRSLNFCMVFATQDISQMEKASPKETLSIMANTNTKIFMRVVRSSNSHQMESLLPIRRKYHSDWEGADDIQSMQISKLHDQIALEEKERFGNGENIQNFLKEIIEIREKQLANRINDPAFDFSNIYPSLQPGEFILTQGKDFLLGQSFYTGNWIVKDDIKLNHFTSQRISNLQLTKAYQIEKEREHKLKLLVNDPLEFLKGETLIFEKFLSSDKISASTDELIQKSFAIIGYYDFIEKDDLSCTNETYVDLFSETI